MVEACVNTRTGTNNLAILNMVQLQEIAETICVDALERAYPPPTRSKPSRDRQKLLQDPSFLQRFKVGLANGLTASLAAYDHRVLSASLFEGTLNPYSQTAFCSPAENNTHLLILVSKRSAALCVLATALDQALVREIQKLLPSLSKQQRLSLNPIFITEADVMQHKGYAMLLSSTFVPPLTVWKQN